MCITAVCALPDVCNVMKPSMLSHHCVFSVTRQSTTDSLFLPTSCRYLEFWYLKIMVWVLTNCFRELSLCTTKPKQTKPKQKNPVLNVFAPCCVSCSTCPVCYQESDSGKYLYVRHLILLVKIPLWLMSRRILCLVCSCLCRWSQQK